MHSSHKDRSPGDAPVTDLSRTHSGPDNTDRPAIEMEGHLQLRITDIDPYDKNPRQVANEKYEEIKESIRNSRMQSPLVVSKRPASTRYMVSAGGNTRLKAQKELWLETQDSRYEQVLVIYRPWESELKVLAAHVTENELRGSMVFWDKARGVWAMKLELERERGQSLSLRQLHDALRGYGLTASITLLSFYGFALDNLAELGEATRWLSKTTVEALQPTFKHLSTYLIAAHQQSPDAWHALRIDVLRNMAQFALAPDTQQDSEFMNEPGRERPLTPEALTAALEAAVARALGQSVQQVREVRLLAKVMPILPMADLIQQYQATQASQASLTLPTRPTDALPGESVASRPGSPPLDARPPPEATHAGMGEQTQNDPANTTVATSAATSDLLKNVQRHITAMARVCNFADCLRLTDAMPAGFYVESPADDTPLDLDPAHTDSRNRYVGWWLAAMHSGQIGGDYSHRLPTESTWRQAQRQEAGHDENALTWLIDTVLGNPIGLVEMADWLTHPATQAMADYHHLVRALQRLRTEAAQRFTAGGTPS